MCKRGIPHEGEMKILDPADVYIIGGGLVGSQIAYNLTIEKKRVILVEKKFLTAGASGLPAERPLFLGS
jgi:glycerol-3-phosphate dehydrogenase